MDVCTHSHVCAHTFIRVYKYVEMVLCAQLYTIHHPPPPPSLTRLRPLVLGIPIRGGRPSVRPPFGGRPDDGSGGGGGGGGGDDRRPRVKAASAEPRKKDQFVSNRRPVRPVAEAGACGYKSASSTGGKKTASFVVRRFFNVIQYVRVCFTVTFFYEDILVFLILFYSDHVIE